MSWSFSATGKTKEEVRADLDKKQESCGGNFDDEARAAVDAALEALPSLSRSEIVVTTYGHFSEETEQSRGTSNITITVSNTFLPEGATRVSQEQIDEAQGR